MTKPRRRPIFGIRRDTRPEKMENSFKLSNFIVKPLKYFQATIE